MLLFRSCVTLVQIESTQDKIVCPQSHGLAVCPVAGPTPRER